MDKVFYIHQLKNSAIVFEDLLSSLPRERLDHVFGGTVWTIHEHVQHLAMTQIMLQKRIQQFITQEEPRIIPFTPSGHAEKSNLKPINELVGIFKKWRTQQIDAINEAGEKICKKLALHPEYVEYSFPILIRHIILHDYFHYYRIEELGLLKTENITSI